MVAASCPALRAQSETQRGIVGGGVAGAVIGGIIGHQNDETAGGALIGGAVGAMAGGLLGQEKDRQMYQQYQVRQQQAARFQAGVSSGDVVMMTGSGVSPQVIINQIQVNGVRQRPDVHEIISLHQQGVAEPVIDAMQRARLATAPSPVVYPRPVVVERCYPPDPVIIYRPAPAPIPWRYDYYRHHHH